MAKAFKVESISYPIIEGPNREDLFDSLRLFKEGRIVEFTLESGAKMELVVTGISIEDGSGQSWLIEGNLQKMSFPPGYPIMEIPSFIIWFHTRTRRGTLTVPKPSR